MSNLAVDSSYHLVVAEAVMLVELAHWTEIKSQVPNNLAIMGAIAHIISRRLV